MSESLSVLLTNDDGIDAVGIQALYQAFDDIAEVTVVAPTDDQSAVGRQLSSDVTIHEHDWGYGIDGTPADCVVAGVEALCPDVDLVIAGCNKGANIGAYVLGRSGTVSAAVESTFFDVPAMAVSMYIPGGGDTPWHKQATEVSAFADASRAATYLARHAFDAGVFEQADYLNINAPVAANEPATLEVTRPSRVYDMTAEHDGNGTVTLHDRVWERMRTDDIPDPSGTDRRAVVDGHISVSPLAAPHTTEHHEALDALASTYLDSI